MTSDPFWFQAFGCVLGFDWHSSGVTTTVCAAVNESLRDAGPEWGLFAVGGKGATAKKSPLQIVDIYDRLGRDADVLVRASRTAAKVDNAAVQDGYRLYHHVFLFTASGSWSVVQQGMNDGTSTARRYHWLSEHVTSFVDEPHDGVCCDVRGDVLNLVAAENRDVRRASAELAGLPPETTLRAIERVPDLPARPPPALSGNGCRLADADQHARSRALCVRTRRQGRHPYPVDRPIYDRTIAVLRRADDRARVGRSERIGALKRLAVFHGS